MKLCLEASHSFQKVANFSVGMYFRANVTSIVTDEKHGQTLVKHNGKKFRYNPISADHVKLQKLSKLR